MKPWIRRAVMVVGVVLLLAGGVAVSGVVPLKASSGHWPITRWLLDFSKNRSVASWSIGVDVPVLDDAGWVVQGAGNYDLACRGCHGAPGRPRPLVAAQMLPPPPDLAQHVNEVEPRELFYVVKHGLKFTGMPAWPAKTRDDEVWAIVAFLRKLPELDRAGYDALVAGSAEGSGAPASTGVAALDPKAAAVAQSCLRCHGPAGTGRGGGTIPSIAGQRQPYLENALRAYAVGARQGGAMQSVAAGLSSDDRREVSAYFARLPTRRQGDTTGEDDPSSWEEGRRLAHHGDPRRRIPACVECHDSSGERRNPAFPSLSGQYARYLEAQLVLFERNQRGGSDYAHLMQPIAARLSPQEKRSVARYFESLAPRTAPVAESKSRDR